MENKELDTFIPKPWEPKKNNIFLVNFPEEFGIEVWTINSISKPKYIDGKWGNILITFRDPIGPSVSEALFKFLKNQINIDKKVNFDLNIQSLDPTSVVIEDWLINVEEILSFDFGELDVSDDNCQLVSIVIKPLNCELLDLKK